MSSQRLLFDAPGTYRIRVHGRLATSWSDRLGDMTISVRRGAGKRPITTLTGELIDQASLMGVLSTLYDMGFTLLDLKRLPDKVVAAVADTTVAN